MHVDNYSVGCCHSAFDLRTHLQSSNENTSLNVSLSNREFMEYVYDLKRTYRIIKRILKGVRNVVTNNFSRLIEKCINTNDTTDWRELLLFAYKSLRLPEKEAGTSLVQIIKQNSSSSVLPTHNRKPSNKQSSLSSRVEAKLADFNIRGAVKLMSSTDSLTGNSSDTFEQLLRKHPEPSRILTFPNEPDETIQPLQVDTGMV